MSYVGARSRITYDVDLTAAGQTVRWENLDWSGAEELRKALADLAVKLNEEMERNRLRLTPASVKED